MSKMSPTSVYVCVRFDCTAQPTQCGLNLEAIRTVQSLQNRTTTMEFLSVLYSIICIRTILQSVGTVLNATRILWPRALPNGTH